MIEIKDKGIDELQLMLKEATESKNSEKETDLNEMSGVAFSLKQNL